MESARVALITMPFDGVHSPSLALSLLNAELAEAGIACDVHYLNLAWAEVIGVERYDRYACDLSGAFLGEWVFSDCLTPRSEVEAERFVEEVVIPQQCYTLDDIERCEEDRLRAHAFLEACLHSVDWACYRVIGFTSMFQQNTASLAFARMVKQLAPEATIVFGGANCEGGMGEQIWKSFPWVDAVCTGEGDEVFPDLVRRILSQEAWGSLPGIVGPRGAAAPPPSRMVRDLDRLPIPDYSAYFARLDDCSIRDDLHCQLPVETSRGCWWGEKHHCTFCGLNGTTMGFRSKSPDRAIREIRQLVATYGDRLGVHPRFFMTDNILDMKYFRSVLPALRDAGADLRLFYETKANLGRDQVRMLAESGVREIQPGIESLHTAVLKLMRKGCTALQNIQLLKWCQEYGITTRWNILHGFPGEDPLWYEEQARTIRRIVHLDPPAFLCTVRLDRFSPYFVDAERFGIDNVRPARALGYIYALPPEELHGIAYHFDFDFRDGRVPRQYVQPVYDAVATWMEQREQAFLYALSRDDQVALWDGRAAGPGTVHVLRGAQKAVYEYCDRVRGRAELLDHARAAGLGDDQTNRMLDEWTDAGLILEDGGCLLAIAVSAPCVRAAGSTVSDEAAVAVAAVDGLALRPHRRAAPHAVEVGDDLFLLDRDRRHMTVLDPVSAAIWEQCDGTRSIAEIADAIAARVGRPRDTIRSDTTRAVRDLTEAGLVELIEPGLG